MVTTRGHSNRNNPFNAPAEGGADEVESGVRGTAGDNQVPTPGPTITFNDATMAAFRSMIQQMVREAMPEVAPNQENVAETIRVGAMRTNDIQEREDGASFTSALKTFNAMKPDTYDGSGEPASIHYWFSHIERLLRNVHCSEADKVHIAALKLREEASEWWESSKLSEHPELSWGMFKEKMTNRFFSPAMKDEKLDELFSPKVKGLSVLERAKKFNHLLQYAGPEISSEEQKIRRFHKWMSDTIKPWMVNRHFSTLEEYVDAAYRIEATLNESERRKNSGGKPHH